MSRHMVARHPSRGRAGWQRAAHGRARGLAGQGGGRARPPRRGRPARRARRPRADRLRRVRLPRYRGRARAPAGPPDPGAVPAARCRRRRRQRQRRRSPPTQTSRTSAGPPSANTFASASSASSAWPSATSSVLPASGRSHSASNCLPTDRSPTCSPRPERVRAGRGGQVQQVRRRERGPVGAEQLLHEVGLQPLPEQREARARADVGAQRDPDAALDVPAQREQPAAQRALLVGQCATAAPRLRQQVAARRRRGARCARARCAARAARAGRRCRCSARVREEPAHGVDLGAVLVDVRGEQRAVDVAEHRRARLEHRLAARTARTAG